MNLQQGCTPSASPRSKTTTRRQYLALALAQPVDWLKFCAARPGPYMRPIHVTLIRIAIRRKELPC
jgi:hypothetical protein